MSEMVERVARALCRTVMTDEDAWACWVQDARAAIEAMREPTPAMVEAGLDWGEASTISVWEKMIDAVLRDD